MDVFEADYSDLFAAGLRGIQSRGIDPDGSSSEPHIHPAILSSIDIDAGSADRDHDQDFKDPTVRSPFWKSFLLPTRLWRRPQRFPRIEKTSSSVVRSLKTRNDAVSRSARRQSIPSDVVEESPLKLRILDWSLRVSNAVSTIEEEGEGVDPYLFDQIDPVDEAASTPTKILLTLPTSVSLGEREISPALEQHGYHMHLMLPSLRHQSFFSSDDETTWESASTYSSEDESGLNVDWDQFRVEWIDFDGAH